jgi:hypothetical protein
VNRRPGAPQSLDQRLGPERAAQDHDFLGTECSHGFPNLPDRVNPTLQHGVRIDFFHDAPSRQGSIITTRFLSWFKDRQFRRILSRHIAKP